MPELKGKLPQSQRAIKAWEVLEGNKEREPMCRETAGLMIEALARRNEECAWMAWSQLDTAMREQDLEQLSSDDISVGHSGVGLALGVLERGESTKTGSAQGVEVRDPALQSFFAQRKLELLPGDKVFKTALRIYRRIWMQELTARGWQDLGSVHLWRHTEAVHLLLYEDWTRDKVRDHCRWATDESLSHYGKRHLLRRNEERLSPEERERGNWLWERPRERFGLTPSPPPTPQIVPLSAAYPELAPLELA
jgi:hypothetical protein